MRTVATYHSLLVGDSLDDDGGSDDGRRTRPPSAIASMGITQ
jgi:hypothetical protein